MPASYTVYQTLGCKLTPFVLFSYWLKDIAPFKIPHLYSFSSLRYYQSFQVARLHLVEMVFKSFNTLIRVAELAFSGSDRKTYFFNFKLICADITLSSSFGIPFTLFLQYDHHSVQSVWWAPSVWEI